MLFCDYFNAWIYAFKEGEVREVTFAKYLNTEKNLRLLVPDLDIAKLNRQSYQKIINGYAETHERVTTMDFHHHLHAAILDAIDDGLLKIDPARKVVIKGKPPSKKKDKYLNQAELKKLMDSLDLTKKSDWIIYIAAKTGARYAEILGITPEDINVDKRVVSINKTWNYKQSFGGFEPTKNLSSVREVEVDNTTIQLLKTKIEGQPPREPLFVSGRAFSSNDNDRLKKLCTECKIPVISLHGLRHTHASLLLYAGVSVASISKRLGHADINTTQSVYMHVVEELRSKDSVKAMSFLEAM